MQLGEMETQKKKTKKKLETLHLQQEYEEKSRVLSDKTNSWNIFIVKCTLFEPGTRSLHRATCAPACEPIPPLAMM